jgi:hypothetical protein
MLAVLVLRKGHVDDRDHTLESIIVTHLQALTIIASFKGVKEFDKTLLVLCAMAPLQGVDENLELVRLNYQTNGVCGCSWIVIEQAQG